MSWDGTDMQPVASDLSQPPSPPTPPTSATSASKPQARKRQLTQAEKANIQRFHRENPFVTHNHIAGRSFWSGEKVETRVTCYYPSANLHTSTVSKILGQAHIEPSPQAHPEQQAGGNGFTPRASKPGAASAHPTLSKVQRALFQWAQQTQSAGIRVTQPMLRQEAAALAAMAWTERSPASSSVQFLENQNTTPLRSSSFSMSSNAWDGAWTPPMSPFPPATPAALPVSAANVPYEVGHFSQLSPGITSLPPISMHDILSAVGPTQQFQFEPGVFENTAALAPSVDDARGALDTLQEHMKQGEPLTPFDYLCLEHLRERLSGSASQVGMQMETENYSWDGFLT